ncbi:MAG: hypothetical protein KJ062_07880 [Thermoanaerobaculia bacterium]|nr:hypothetical protein [Thermoanaerobaculia bacterium]
MSTGARRTAGTCREAPSRISIDEFFDEVAKLGYSPDQLAAAGLDRPAFNARIIQSCEQYARGAWGFNVRHPSLRVVWSAYHASVIDRAVGLGADVRPLLEAYPREADVEAWAGPFGAAARDAILDSPVLSFHVEHERARFLPGRPSGEVPYPSWAFQRSVDPATQSLCATDAIRYAADGAPLGPVFAEARAMLPGFQDVPVWHQRLAAAVYARLPAPPRVRHCLDTATISFATFDERTGMRCRRTPVHEILMGGLDLLTPVEHLVLRKNLTTTRLADLRLPPVYREFVPEHRVALLTAALFSVDEDPHGRGTRVWHPLAALHPNGFVATRASDRISTDWVEFDVHAGYGAEDCWPFAGRL